MYIEIHRYQILLRMYLIFLSTTVIDAFLQNVKLIILKNIKTYVFQKMFTNFWFRISTSVRK